VTSITSSASLDSNQCSSPSSWIEAPDYFTDIQMAVNSESEATDYSVGVTLTGVPIMYPTMELLYDPLSP
jgi:hypothetical protein